MMLHYSPGMAMRRDFGAAACPYCKKPFVKANKNQITCGAARCRDARGRETDRQNSLKKRRRLEAAKAAESAGAE